MDVFCFCADTVTAWKVRCSRGFSGFCKLARERASGALHAAMLHTLPDDTLVQVIVACNDSDTGNGVPRLESVKGLACSKGLLEQLHRLQPLVGVKSLAVAPTHGPWRVGLLYKGKLTAAMVEQARQGRVRSIDMRCTTLAPAVAKRVVPELLGAGCSLLQLSVVDVKLNGTWASIFGEAAVCSAALRSLRLEGCGLQGPLPELRLPALQVLDLFNNQLSGGLEPLRRCTALQALFLNRNELTGRLGPLRSCTALKTLNLCGNQFMGGLDPLRGCKALQKLDLACNAFTGGLEPLRGCTALRKLSMDDNQLTGSLAPLQGCAALQHLFLANNHHTGSLAPLQDCTALQNIVLDENQLTGGLEPLRRCTALEMLSLDGNQLNGGLEPLQGCTALQVLWLTNNQLTGGLEPLRGFAALRECGLAGLGLMNAGLTGGLGPLEGCTAVII